MKGWPEDRALRVAGWGGPDWPRLFTVGCCGEGEVLGA